MVPASTPLPPLDPAPLEASAVRTNPSSVLRPVPTPPPALDLVQLGLAQDLALALLLLAERVSLEIRQAPLRPQVLLELLA